LFVCLFVWLVGWLFGWLVVCLFVLLGSTWLNLDHPRRHHRHRCLGFGVSTWAAAVVHGQVVQSARQGKTGGNQRAAGDSPLQRRPHLLYPQAGWLMVVMSWL
jgi:hypothetical protein